MNEHGLQGAERILDEMPLGLWVARAPGGEVLYTNYWFRRITGAAAVDGSAIGAAPAGYGIYDRSGKLYPVENLPFSRALARREPVIVDDIVVHRHDGARVCVRAFANPVLDEQGEVSHVVIAFTDITPEVRAVVEHAQIEKHLEVAIHHAPVLLFMLDRAGVLTVADGALRETLDRGRQMVGQSILDAYKEQPTVLRAVRSALAGETASYSVEVRGLALDVWIGPVRDAGGEIAGAIGVCTDVTEQRRLQTRLIHDDRIRAMGTMAASVAHEINNPLTYVLAGLEEATRELRQLSTMFGAIAHRSADESVAAAARNGIDRVHECLAPTIAGTERIRQVTQQLSTFTRPNDEQRKPIQIGDVVRSVPTLVRKEIEARARFVEEIGATPVVLANEARLLQVLVNLLVNAWQALPTSDPARHVIGIRTGTRGPDALIEVWDSGTGVAPQLRERIFEPFVTTKEIGNGTGLGLFVCRNIISSLEGHISVHDAEGGGALFRVVLPATEQRTAAPSAQKVESDLNAEGRRRCILIIDDDARVAAALASRFATENFEVRTVHDGRQGLEIILTDDRLDLAYCDLMMQGFSGLDLHNELLRKAPERLSKVVFMTGGAFTTEARSFLDQRREVVVEKPFDIMADVRQRVG